MTPFNMHDYGELRRQELLDAGARYALLGNLPRGSKARFTSGALRQLATAICQATLGKSLFQLRHKSTTVLAGERP